MSYGCVPMIIRVAEGETRSDAHTAGSARQGSVQMPSSFDGSTLEYECTNRDDPQSADFMIPTDAGGTALPALTVAGNGAYELPEIVRHFKYFRLKLAAQTSGAIEIAAVLKL